MKKIIQKLFRANRQIHRLYTELNDMKFYLRRLLLEEKILNSTERGVTDEKYCDAEIIITLTTYGRRLMDVCFTIESLMQQTRKANKIILWIDEETMKHPLPEALLRQQKRGLNIESTKDIRSYKKIIPALKKYPDAVLITVDDDVIYDFDIIERLTNAYLSEPKCIHAGRTHVITTGRDGKPCPYEQWQQGCYDSSQTNRTFFTGVGGVLYPPHSLPAETLNEEVFMSICPTADDVWLNVMARLQDTPIHKIPTRSTISEDYIMNRQVQDMALANVNTGDTGGNDRQIKAVFEKYQIKI